MWTWSVMYVFLKVKIVVRSIITSQERWAFVSKVVLHDSYLAVCRFRGNEKKDRIRQVSGHSAVLNAAVVSGQSRFH